MRLYKPAAVVRKSREMWWWTFALLALCGGVPLNPRDEVRIDIGEQAFVQLLLGNPGRHVTLRLNHNLDHIELHAPLESASRTVETLPNGWHSELFYIGDGAPLRLPFRYSSGVEVEAVELLATPGSSSGTLGLGKYSPLWQHWRRFSFSQQSLLLGGYDSYAQLEPSYLAPLMTVGQASAQLNDSLAVPLVLAPGHMDTYYPYQLGEPPQQFTMYAGGCDEAYTLLDIEGACSEQALMQMHPQRMHLRNGQTYIAMRPSHDGELRLGKRFLADYMCFCDWDGGRWGIGESIYSFGASSVNAACALLLVVLVTVWLSLALNRPGSEDEWVFLLVLFIEGFTYLTAAVTLYVNFAGYHWSRFVSNFHESTATPTLAFLTYNLLACSMGFVVLLLRTVRLPLFLGDSPQRHTTNVRRLEANMHVRLFCYLGASLPALWVCVLPGHRSGADVTFLLFFSTVLATAALGITLHASIRRYRFWPLFAVHTALYYWFLVFCNVLPSAHMLDLHESRLALVVLYLALLGVFVPLYLLGEMELAWQRHQKKH